MFLFLPPRARPLTGGRAALPPLGGLGRRRSLLRRRWFRLGISGAFVTGTLVGGRLDPAPLRGGRGRRPHAGGGTVRWGRGERRGESALEQGVPGPFTALGSGASGELGRSDRRRVRRG